MSTPFAPEPPPLSVLDRRGRDGLLDKLRACFSEVGEAGRPDIAPDLLGAERAQQLYLKEISTNPRWRESVRPGHTVAILGARPV